MSVTVRAAKHDDVEWIVEELKAFSAFFGSKIRLFPDEEHARNGIKAHIDNHLILVAEKAGEFVGFISGIYGRHMYNPSISTLTETFWWVTPKHRNSRAGLVLLNEFVRIGKEKSNWILFTLEHKSPVNDRCLTARGFNLIERNYLMEVGV